MVSRIVDRCLVRPVRSSFHDVSTTSVAEAAAAGDAAGSVEAATDSVEDATGSVTDDAEGEEAEAEEAEAFLPTRFCAGAEEEEEDATGAGTDTGASVTETDTGADTAAAGVDFLTVFLEGAELIVLVAGIEFIFVLRTDCSYTDLPRSIFIFYPLLFFESGGLPRFFFEIGQIHDILLYSFHFAGLHTKSQQCVRG
jgi:hypothetical protein